MRRLGVDIGDEIAALANLSREELAALWQRAHGSAVPKGIRHDLLIRSAAWQLQAKRFGGLSPNTRRALTAAIKEVERGLMARSSRSPKLDAEDDPRSTDKPVVVQPLRTLSPGARVIRDWNGKSYGHCSPDYRCPLVGSKVLWTMSAVPKLRCAVYTRKSTEDGLDQEFNSLDAQRDACSSFIASQGGLGWKLVADRYDDGGISGGTVSLGYQVKSRKLLIKEPEATFVRSLFTRYLELKSVPKLAAEVTRQAVAAEQYAQGDPDRSIDDGRAKPTTFARQIGNCMMYKLLSNPIYIGKLRHRDNVYDGEHQPIIDVDLFDRVQQLMASQATTPRGSIIHKEVHLLTGLLFDDAGDCMSPTHAKAHGKRYRYYISSRIKGKGRTDNTAWRIPAIEIEAVAVRFATNLLADKTRLLDWLQVYEPSADRQAALDATAILSTRLRSQASTERQSIIAAIFPKIILEADAIRFEVDVSTLVRKLVANDGTSDAMGPDLESAVSFETLTLPIQMKRCGNEMRMVVEGTDSRSDPDPSLVALIAKAHFYLASLIEAPQLSITDLADRFGVDRVDVGRILPLAFLAPRLTDQILTGNQPTDISARHLARLILSRAAPTISS